MAKFDNILDDIGTKVIDEVLSDYKKKYLDEKEVIYVMDPDDILNFCFPYGTETSLDVNTEKKSIYLGQELNALNYILDKKIVVILDEYNDEILESVGKIYSTFSNEKLFKTIVKKESFKDLIEAIKENRGFLYAFMKIASISSFTKYKEILSKDLFIENKNNVNYKRKTEVDSLKLILAKAKVPDLIIVKKIYDSYLKSLTKIQMTKHDSIDSSNKYSNFRKSLLRDIIAINRVSILNGFDSNYHFIYHSSTPTKTNKIISLFEKEHKEHKQEINFWRDKSHSYLKYWLNPFTFEERIPLIDALIELASKPGKLSKKKANPQFKEIEESLNDKNAKKRDDLEDSFIINCLNNNNETLGILNKITDIDNLDNVALNELNNELSSAVEKFNNELLIFEKDFLKDRIKEVNLYYTLSEEVNIFLGKNFRESEQNQVVVTNNLGKDLIRGAFHHLPIALFIDYDEDSYKRSFGTVCQIVLAIIKRGSLNKSHILQLIVDDERDSANDEVKELTNLLLFLFFNNLNGRPDDEVNKYFIDFDYIIGTKGNQSDWYYMYVWILRRCRDYSKSLEVALLAEKKFPNDPRFIHGECLANICLMEDNNKLDKKNVVKLKSIIKLAEKAIQKYAKVASINNRVNVVWGQKVNLLNIIAYRKCKLYEIDNKYCSLGEIRNTIIEIKEILSKNIPGVSNTYNKYPEITHTESILEYFEALKKLEIGDVENAKSKISKSLERVNQSMINDGNNQLYIKDFEMIKSKYKEINGDNFSK